jgi:hypothetical protein
MDRREVAFEPGFEAGKLWPIRVETDAEQADAGELGGHSGWDTEESFWYFG